jgi:alcohol dehydrogenase (cytochrome c)
LVWYKQFLPHDVHDYDLTHVNPIFTIHSRTAIATSGKDGMLRVVDRDSHQMLYSAAFTTRLNAEAPSGVTPIHACPGPLGGDEWNSAAYDPMLRLLVVPSNDHWCAQLAKDSEPPSVEAANAGQTRYFGGPIGLDPYSEARGRLTGFDASTGKERWRYQSPSPLVAGVVLTASKLVFTGEVGGYFDAMDAGSGKILLRLNLADSIQGGVITYGVRGVQYVAVVSGDGGVINKKIMGGIHGGNPTVTLLALPTQ